MIKPSEENLLGYLIRANEEHEQEELAEQIRCDAELRKECQLLHSGLALPAATRNTSIRRLCWPRVLVRGFGI